MHMVQLKVSLQELQFLRNNPLFCYKVYSLGSCILALQNFDIMVLNTEKKQKLQEWKYTSMQVTRILWNMHA